jgi:hypothetical protein
MKNILTEARFQFLAGVINESEFKQLTEDQIPQDIEALLDNMINMEIPEDAEAGDIVSGVWPASEYTDETAYGDAANEFKTAYDYINNQGGRITIPGNPDVTYTSTQDGSIEYNLKVTLD